MSKHVFKKRSSERELSLLSLTLSRFPLAAACILMAANRWSSSFLCWINLIASRRSCALFFAARWRAWSWIRLCDCAPIQCRLVVPLQQWVWQYKQQRTCNSPNAAKRRTRTYYWTQARSTRVVGSTTPAPWRREIELACGNAAPTRPHLLVGPDIINGDTPDQETISPNKRWSSPWVWSKNQSCRLWCTSSC